MFDHDLAKPTKDQIARTPKYKAMIPNARSKFFMVRCGICQKLTTCFSHSSVFRSCKGCGAVILTPRGGRAVVSDGCAIKCAEKHFADINNDE